MLRRLKNKRGEGYIDTCVLVLVFVMAIVITLNIMSFITERQELEIICDNLVEVATATGEFGNDYFNTINELADQYGFFGTSLVDNEFTGGYTRVQLGDRMTVEVSRYTYIKGLGVFKIPLSIKVKKSGLSEKYWK